MKESMIFYRSRDDYRAAWILSMMAIITSKLTNQHLYYIQYYLFSVGIISYYINAKGFIEINEKAICINLGFLTSKRKISISFGKIKNISYVKDPREWRTNTYGILGSRRPIDEYCILFAFDEELPTQIKTMIKKYGDKLYYNRFFLKDNGMNLIMLSYPEGGL